MAGIRLRARPRYLPLLALLLPVWPRSAMATEPAGVGVEPPPQAAPPATPPAQAPPPASPPSATTPAPAPPVEVAPPTTASPVPDPPPDQTAGPDGSPSSLEAGPSETSGSGGLFEQSVSAEEVDPSPTVDPTAEPSSVAATALGFDIDGHIRSDVFVGKVPDLKQPEMKAAYGEAALKLRVRKAPYGDAFAETRLRYGYEDEELGPRLDLREAYVNAYAGPLDIRLGHQIIVWGRADILNPTNVLTPIDFRVRSPNEDDRRVANTGLRIFLNFAPVRIEGVWMPLYAATQLPRFELDDYIEFAEPDYPKPRLTKGLGAGRVHLELAQFEMSGSYVYGHAPLPGVALLDYDVYAGPPVIRISRTAYNHHVVGLDFSTAIGDILGLRGEAAYRQPIDYADKIYAPNPDLQYVVGVDREFGNVSLIAQYLGRYVFDWSELPPAEDDVDLAQVATVPPPLPPLITDQINAAIDSQLAITNRLLHQQTAPVQHSASLRAEWRTLHDTLSLSAIGLVNFSTLEWMLQPKMGYSITDGMIISLGGEILVGPDGTLLGAVDELLTAGYAELKLLL